MGTTESEVCNNRGDCDPGTGVCACYKGYGPSNGQGLAGMIPDCGNITVTPSGCPMNCNAHGTCSGGPNYRCTCYNGWRGANCALRTCPVGFAWYDEATVDNTAHAPATCSNVGACNAYGECTCRPGFEGAACDRAQCPSAVSNVACSGHGSCVTLQQLTALNTVNGQPVGALEVQTVTCTAASGTVTFGWQYASTLPVASSASLSTVRAALATLPPLRGVTVSFDSGATTLCSTPGGNVLRITFTQNLGPQPLITATTSPVLLMATVAQVTAGSQPSYGQTDGAAATWDAVKMYGCLCDADLGRNGSRVSGGDLAPYIGNDCSLRSCALGHDPQSSVVPLSEKQNVTCAATSGSISLTFRGQTAVISSSAIATDIVTALENLAT